MNFAFTQWADFRAGHLGHLRSLELQALLRRLVPPRGVSQVRRRGGGGGPGASLAQQRLRGVMFVSPIKITHLGGRSFSPEEVEGPCPATQRGAFQATPGAGEDSSSDSETAEGTFFAGSLARTATLFSKEIFVNH